VCPGAGLFHQCCAGRGRIQLAEQAAQSLMAEMGPDAVAAGQQNITRLHLRNGMGAFRGRFGGSQAVGQYVGLRMGSGIAGVQFTPVEQGLHMRVVAGAVQQGAVAEW